MRNTVLADLTTATAQDFVAKYLFDRTPFAFSQRENFVRWKMALGNAIEVDAASVTLVGSAAIGVSLNPDKNFAEFSAGSDVDVAVISMHHFNVAWRFLRNGGNIRMGLPHRQRVAWDEHVTRLIYWGIIATDKLLPLMPFAKGWMRAASTASMTPDVGNREVKFRIYADYESLRAYQIQSVKRIQALLIERGGLPSA